MAPPASAAEPAMLVAVAHSQKAGSGVQPHPAPVSGHPGPLWGCAGEPWLYTLL